MDTFAKLYPLLMRGNDDNVADCFETILRTSPSNRDKGEVRITHSAQMIAYVRDPVRGLGERDLSYAMICVWYRYDPVKAMCVLHMFTENIDDSGGFSSYGSWADIKYFCQYVRNSKLVLSQKDRDTMTDTAIGILVHQLKKDRDAWNRAMVRYLQIKRVDPNTLVERPVGRDVMSFAAKWTPREKRKFGWIFSRMVPIFGNTDERRLRKMLSALNRELDTVQIKQCAGRWSEIEPESVSVTTLGRQFNSFAQFYSADRAECAKNFKEFMDQPCKTKFGVAEMVCLAFRTDRDSNLLNKLWANVVDKQSRGNVIPIVDIAWSQSLSQSHRQYQFIGDGILCAQRNMERILLVGHIPEWIEAKYSDTFIDIIDRIKPHIERSTDSSLERAFGMMRESFSMSKSDPKSITFYVLSDQRISNEYNVVYTMPTLNPYTHPRYSQIIV
jgi:hypothetical protein